MSNSTSQPANNPDPSPADLRMPVETEIYILPNGEIVVADLPVELAALLSASTVPAPSAEASADGQPAT
jgi:hypothetical protein